MVLQEDTSDPEAAVLWPTTHTQPLRFDYHAVAKYDGGRKAAKEERAKKDAATSVSAAVVRSSSQWFKTDDPPERRRYNVGGRGRQRVRVKSAEQLRATAELERGQAGEDRTATGKRRASPGRSTSQRPYASDVVALVAVSSDVAVCGLRSEWRTAVCLLVAESTASWGTHFLDIDTEYPYRLPSTGVVRMRQQCTALGPATHLGIPWHVTRLFDRWERRK